MKTSASLYEPTGCIFFAVLLIPAIAFSQYRQSFFQLEGFSVKTDALQLLKTAIKGSESYSLSGEMYFNDEYSIDIDAGIDTESDPGLKRTQKTLTGQFRWYFKQGDCPCSAFFVGTYFGSVSIRQTVDKRHINNDAVNYHLSTSEEDSVVDTRSSLLLIMWSILHYKQGC